MNAIELYKKYFPHAQPNFFQLDYIEANVTDLNKWNEALQWWCLNDYRAQSVFKIVEYYKEAIKQRSSAQVGANDYQPEQYKCGTCFDRKQLGEVIDGKFQYFDCPDCVGVKA